MKVALITGVTDRMGLICLSFCSIKGMMSWYYMPFFCWFRERIVILRGTNISIFIMAIWAIPEFTQIISSAPRRIYNLAAQSHVQVSFISRIYR